MSKDRTQVLESGLLLGDRWVRESLGGTMEHINPATGKPHKTFAIASVAEVDEAVAAAEAAPPPECASLLRHVFFECNGSGKQSA